MLATNSGNYQQWLDNFFHFSHTHACVSPRVGPRYIVQLGDKTVDYNEDFRLFMSTRNPLPYIAPDVSSILCEVNFTTTRAGLKGQVAADVVAVVML